MNIPGADTNENEEKEMNSSSPADANTGPALNHTSSLDLSSNTDRHGRRFWESNRPSNPNFTIWEDPPGEEVVTRSTDPTVSTYRPELDENKENIDAAGSDYDAGEVQERQVESIDWSRLEAGPRDVFRLPMNYDMSTFSGGHSPSLHPRRSNLAPPSRQIMTVRTEDGDEDEDSDTEFTNALPLAQRHNLFHLTESYRRNLESRERHGTRTALRHNASVQGPLNFFAEVRRLTDSENSRHHRTPTPEDGQDLGSLEGRRS